MNIWEWFKGLFTNYENCRCCGTKIKNNGYPVPFCGGGFCIKCAMEILRK